MTQAPFSFPDSPDVIWDRRAQILCALCDADEGFCQIPVRSVRGSTLDLLLREYDARFFAGTLRPSYAQLKVALSPRLLSAAGKFLYLPQMPPGKPSGEIRMSSDYLFRLEYGPFSLNGLTVSTPQEAFLVVFEHELCHALEAALYGRTNHGKRFMALVGRLFGHTTATHSLPTRRADAASHGIRVGMSASFSYQNQSLTGTITYIGKTASVMVPSPTGEYCDREGKRYTKYAVPLEQLIIR